MDFIKKNFNTLIILVLAFVILLQRCETSTKPAETEKATITKVVDTSWHQPPTPSPVINVYPQTTTTIPYQVRESKGPAEKIYIPDTNYNTLKQQFLALRDSLLSVKIYNENYKQDSISINITDTITKNKIAGRSYKFNIKYPVIKETITINQPCTPKTQVYLGGGLNGSQSAIIQSINAGAILKTKSDKIYQITTGINTQGQLQVGAGLYWKIKF